MNSSTKSGPHRYRTSRRRFLAATGAAGLAAGLGITSRTGSSSAAAAPKRGGHLRIGSAHGTTTDSLDPGTAANAYMTTTCYTAFSQLTEVNAKGELEPLLAESWEVSDNARKWVFRLRKGVEFHNGKTLNADDVIATLNYHRGPDSKSTANAFVNLIADLKKDDDHTITATLHEGQADFPFVLSAFQLGILPLKDGKLDTASGIGTGAYAVEKFEPGISIIFKRHPNYFREDRAYFDSCEMLVLADAAARQNALVTGQVDLSDRVDLKTVDLLKQNQDLEVLSIVGTLHYTLPMRTDTAPFDNNDVRLALKYAIDREEILRKVLYGYGALGNDHPISPANRYFARELPQRAYDPEKARFHLKQAGQSNLKVDLSTSEAVFPGAVDTAVLYAEQAKKAGIEINVVREADDSYWDIVWLKKPWCMSYWSGRPTEDWMFTQAYAAEANWNDTFWKNDRFNQLLKQARSETDEDKRREMYGEMQAIVSNDGGAVIPMFGNHVMAHSKKVAHHAEVAGNWEKDGGKLIERWWFA
jgi:peptide/nickel transport system substrate-binding protein